MDKAYLGNLTKYPEPIEVHVVPFSYIDNKTDGKVAVQIFNSVVAELK